MGVEIDVGVAIARASHANDSWKWETVAKHINMDLATSHFNVWKVPDSDYAPNGTIDTYTWCGDQCIVTPVTTTTMMMMIIVDVDLT